MILYTYYIIILIIFLILANAKFSTYLIPVRYSKKIPCK